MSGLFLTGKIKTLLDRLTSARAAALDEVTSTRMARLDATVSSRQSEASALSRYNQLISDIAALSAGRVKLIQTGYVNSVRDDTGLGETTSYIDVTLGTAVADTGKCMVTFHGFFSDSPSCSINGTGNTFLATAQLTSTTNLRIASRLNNAGYYFVGRWTVIEYY